MKHFRALIVVTVAMVLALTGCTTKLSDNPIRTDVAKVAEPQPAEVNQPPVQPVVTRDGHDVYIQLTAQDTTVEISKGVFYHAWTFNGTVPGPVLHVKQGDMIHLTLKNMDPNMPHSIDMHAVHAAPSQKFTDVMPNKKGTFTYPATTPGVFMYHCGTAPVLMHLANGMYGMIIVDPKDGYPTDAQVDREYTIVQSEWYKENDYQDFLNGSPRYVVFNGNDFALKDHPFLAKVGDKVRFYIINAGPNEVSSFHIVGTTMDDVYIDGNPKNHLYGLQTVMLPASGGAVVEATVTEAGDYPIVTHQFKDAAKGAVAILRATPDGKDNGMPAMGH